MIEKVSFESVMPALRKPCENNTVHPQYKDNIFYNSQTYILASLSGLAVIGLGCLLGPRNVNNTVRQVVNHTK